MGVTLLYCSLTYIIITIVVEIGNNRDKKRNEEEKT